MKLDRRLDREIDRLCAVEDAIGIHRDAPIIVENVIRVGHQAADFSEDTIWINGREKIASRQRCDLHAMGVHEGIRHHDKAAIRRTSLCCYGRCELRCVAYRRRDRLHVEVRRGSFEGVQKVFGISRRDRIKQDQDPIDVRRNSLSSSNHLLTNVGSIETKPVTLPPGWEKLATKPLPTGSMA